MHCARDLGAGLHAVEALPRVPKPVEGLVAQQVRVGTFPQMEHVLHHSLPQHQRLDTHTHTHTHKKKKKKVSCGARGAKMAGLPAAQSGTVLRASGPAWSPPCPIAASGCHAWRQAVAQIYVFFKKKRKKRERRRRRKRKGFIPRDFHPEIHFLFFY